MQGDQSRKGGRGGNRTAVDESKKGGGKQGSKAPGRLLIVDRTCLQTSNYCDYVVFGYCFMDSLLNTSWGGAVGHTTTAGMLVHAEMVLPFILFVPFFVSPSALVAFSVSVWVPLRVVEARVSVWRPAS